MDQGVVYMATGEDFVGESITSARQLKRVMPDTDVTIFADYEPDVDVFDDCIIIDEPQYDFSDKISHLPETPYEKTLYLDSDVYVHRPIPDVFDVLDNFDMAAALDAHQQPAIHDPEHDAPDIYGQYDPIPEFNTGLLAYRDTESVRECLGIWRESYNSEAHWAGQPSFIPGFHGSDVRICPLPRRYNYIPGLRNSVSGQVKVFHNRLKNGPDPGFKDLPPEQLPQLIERVNCTDRARVTYPYGGELIHYTDLEVLTADPLPVQVLKSIARRGPVDAAQLWLKKLRSQF
jgi:hypothetical protein